MPATRPCHPYAGRKLYKFRDANGTIIFSDRQFAVRDYEISRVKVESVMSRFGLRKVGEGDKCRLVAINEYGGPVEECIDFPESRNVTGITVSRRRPSQRGAVHRRSRQRRLFQGPHLHFAIQKNFGMDLESLPFEFACKYGRAYTPEAGTKFSLNLEDGK